MTIINELISGLFFFCFFFYNTKNVDVLQQLNVRHSAGISILLERHKGICRAFVLAMPVNNCKHLVTLNQTHQRIFKKNLAISYWWRNADQGHVLQSHSNNFGVRRNFLEAIMLLAQDIAGSGSH